MKKIIELAENYLVETRILTLEGDYYKCGVGYELAKAIDHRRKLEQSPITEDWLKEHGFAQNEFRDYEYDLYLNDREDEIRYYRRGGERDSTMSIYRNIGMEDEVCYELPEPYTVAQMLDALELCGITID